MKNGKIKQLHNRDAFIYFFFLPLKILCQLIDFFCFMKQQLIIRWTLIEIKFIYFKTILHHKNYKSLLTILAGASIFSFFFFCTIKINNFFLFNQSLNCYCHASLIHSGTSYWKEKHTEKINKFSHSLLMSTWTKNKISFFSYFFSSHKKKNEKKKDP